MSHVFNLSIIFHNDIELYYIKIEYLPSDHCSNAQNFSAVSLAHLSNSGVQQEKSAFSFPPHVVDWDNPPEEVATAPICQLSFQSRPFPLI